MTDMQKIVIPDIGGASGVDVIELLVKPGDNITKDTPLITLESDKATMEIPSPEAGVVGEISIKVGDKVSEGDVILLYTPSDAKSEEKPAAKIAQEIEPVKTESEVNQPIEVKQTEQPTQSSDHDDSIVLAGPAARRLAHALGIDLHAVHGSGRKARVSKEDVEQYVKRALSQPPRQGLALPEVRTIDFSKFGQISVEPLNKIKRLTGIGVHQSWVTIPHVTQFDTADITDLESFRKDEVAKAKDPNYRLTILAFVCKVICKALKLFPQFNSSLDPTGQNLIYKQYFNIGIAVETPNGLVVPVIKEVNLLSIQAIASEMTRLSTKAREKGLAPADMAGGCFTISSLGGIGGTAFTPIVNSPEVAILGLSKASMQPVYQDGAFVPRLLLPLSLSYDHRVIDGAEAARFTRYLSEALSDIRKILL